MARDVENSTNESASEKAKKRPDALGVILRILLIVAAGLFVTLAILSWPSIRENGFYETFFGSDEDEHEIVRAEELSFVANTRNVFAGYEGGVAILGPSGLQVIDPSGETVLDEAKSFAKPIVRVRGDRLLAYDSGGTNMLTAAAGKASHSTAPGELISAQINKSGVVLRIYRSGSWKAVADVCDADGEPLYEFFSAERYLLGGDVSPDSTRIALAGLRQEDAQLISSVYIYELTEEEPIAFWEAQSSVVISAEFISDDRILAICEDMAVFLDGDTGAELGRYTFGSRELKAYAVGSDFVAFAVSAASGGENAYLATFSPDGDQLAAATLSSVLDLAAYENYLGVLTSEAIMVYNNTLVSVADGASVSGSRRLLIADGTTAYIISADSASVYQY